MAKFDVNALRGGHGLVIDCQSDLNAALRTRIVVPLVRAALLRPLDPRLNPAFAIDGEPHVLAVQMMQTVATRLLDRRIASLAAHDYAITNAIDRLFHGL